MHDRRVEQSARKTMATRPRHDEHAADRRAMPFLLAFGSCHPNAADKLACLVHPEVRIALCRHEPRLERGNGQRGLVLQTRSEGGR